MDLQYGIIVQSDPIAGTVSIKSFTDGSVIKQVTIDSALNTQEQPLINDLCLFVRENDFNARVIKIWSGIVTPNLNPGESVSESKGGALSRLDNLGSASMQSGDLITSLKAISRLLSGLGGVNIESDDITLRTLSNTQIILKLDGTIEITRTDPNQVGVILASVKILPEGKMVVDGTEVFLGPGATAELIRNVFGDVVTGGPFGTHPFDFVTGLPIIGSPTVKAKGFF